MHVYMCACIYTCVGVCTCMNRVGKKTYVDKDSLRESSK